MRCVALHHVLDIGPLFDSIGVPDTLGDERWVDDEDDADGPVLWTRDISLRKYSLSDLQILVGTDTTDDAITAVGNPMLFDTPLTDDSNAHFARGPGHDPGEPRQSPGQQWPAHHDRPPPVFLRELQHGATKDSAAVPQAEASAGILPAGFSLVELLVTIVIMAEILIGVAILFDSSNRLARSQTHLAELQQSLRVGQSEIVRYVRMAGIGGLPITRLNLPADPDGSNPTYDLLGAFPRSGYAVSVLNNVDEDNIVKVVDPSSSATADGEVLAGSDVLVLRGVLTTPLYYFDPPIDISSWITDGLTNPGVDQLVIIPEKVRIVGEDWEDYPQDLDALSERLLAAKARAAVDQRPVAMLVRDTLTPNAYAVMEFDHANTTTTMLDPDTPCASIPDTATYVPNCIQFYLRLDVDQTPGEEYGDLSTGTILEDGAVTVELEPAPALREVEFPSSIGSIGLLEEYRFFVREEYEVPGVDTTRLTPVLSRARFLPGTDVQLDRVDIADNVIDLQIAIGADSQLPGNTGYGVIGEVGADDVPDSDTDGYLQDEILFNAVLDTDTSTGDYSQPPGDAETWYDPVLEYHFLRINTLVQSRFPDPRHLAPGIGDIEDYNRGATVTLGTNRFNDDIRYHRRWLRTVVELRNLL